jgi:hypothetical protein
MRRTTRHCQRRTISFPCLGRATPIRPIRGPTFLLKDSAEEGFSYSDLRRIRLLPAGKPGLGPVLVLLFVEAAVTEVRIEGRRLDTMRDYIRYHRIAWVRELPPGTMLADKVAAVITGITIREVKG